MNNSDLEVWCHRLLKRLPEIQWHLPYWPKGYMNFIPPGLFYVGPDWQPKHAIIEVKKQIMRLLSLDLSRQQAYYLSQKIETQIQVLVLIGQKLEDRKEPWTSVSARTRLKHIEQLKETEADLTQQYQALQNALENSAYQQELHEQLKKIVHQLKHVRHLIEQA